MRKEFRERYPSADYRADTKQRTLAKVLHQMEKSGTLGKVILDAGSGPLVQTGQFIKGEYPMNAVYYPTAGKQIVRVDFAAPNVAEIEKGCLTIRADLESAGRGNLEEKKAIVRAKKFMKLTPKDTTPAVDTIVMSDVLNYIDFRSAITNLGKYLKPGGRMVIHNIIGLGGKATRAPNTSAEIIEHLGKSDYEIEHLDGSNPEIQDIWDKPVGVLDARSVHNYPHVEASGQNCRAILVVARKPA